MITTDNMRFNKLQHWWLIPLGVIFFFTCGLLLFFPTKLLQQQLAVELTTKLNHPIELTGLSLQFPASMFIQKLTSPTELGNVKFTNINLSPVWSRLLSTAPAAKISAEIFGGNIEAQFDTKHRVKLFATALHGALPVPQLPTLHMQATIAQLNASATAEPIIKLEKLHLELSELLISGLKQMGFPIDRLDFGTVNLHLSQNQQRISIDQLISHGGDLIISGGGNVALQRNLRHSRINLKLTLAPRKGLDPSITTLLPMFAKQRQDGSYNVRITGTLAQPRLR